LAAIVTSGGTPTTQSVTYASLTNLLAAGSSKDLRVTWNKTGNNSSTPDALTLQDTTANNAHYATQTITASAGASTVRARIKSGTLRQCVVLANSKYSFFDATSPSFGGIVGATNVQISADADGWCTLSFNADLASGSNLVAIYTAIPTWNNVYAGNASPPGTIQITNITVSQP
jgi:hypothetical protein